MLFNDSHGMPSDFIWHIISLNVVQPDNTVTVLIVSSLRLLSWTVATRHNTCLSQPFCVKETETRAMLGVQAPRLQQLPLAYWVDGLAKPVCFLFVRGRGGYTLTRNKPLKWCKTVNNPYYYLHLSSRRLSPVLQMSAVSMRRITRL